MCVRCRRRRRCVYGNIQANVVHIVVERWWGVRVCRLQNQTRRKGCSANLLCHRTIQRQQFQRYAVYCHFSNPFGPDESSRKRGKRFVIIV